MAEQSQLPQVQKVATTFERLRRRLQWTATVGNILLAGLRAVWFYTTKHAWLTTMLAAAAVFGGEFFASRITNYAVVALMGGAAVRVLLWQGSLAEGAATIPGRLYRAMTVKDWLTPIEAVNTFCDRRLLAEYSNRAREYNEIEAKYQAELHAQTGDAAKALAAAYLPRSNERYQAQAARTNAEEACLNDVRRRLERGELLSKGLRVPYVVGTEEVVIPAHEWRILHFDFERRTARAKEFSYEGVVVGKPR